MVKTKSSRRWLDRHFKDPYVKLAQREGYRSRAVFKLLEIQDKDRILAPGMLVVDLGSAPGGWSQAASRIVGSGCPILALDLLPMDPLPGVRFIHGDFREDVPLAELQKALDGDTADVVLSDMAPNMSGNPAVDQPRMIYLCELTLDLARSILKPGGSLVAKIFQGEGFEAFHKEVRTSFRRVATRKPKSSRPRSREIYLVATGFSL